jgi:hypothetical protein
MNEKLTIASSARPWHNTILSQEGLQWKNLLTHFIPQCKLITALKLLGNFGFRNEVGLSTLSWGVL